MPQREKLSVDLCATSGGFTSGITRVSFGKRVLMQRKALVLFDFQWN